MDDIVAAVKEAFESSTHESFERRVERQAAQMHEDYRRGRLDNPEYAVGLELEAYVVDDDGRLQSVPDEVFERTRCSKELGVHNLELHTPPDVFDAAGVERQATEIRERIDRTRTVLDSLDRRLVLDSMWTVPPAGGSARYLSEVVERDGVVVAKNMRTDARYHALDNEVRRRAGGAIDLSFPGAEVSFPSILVESLATSLQPHLQIPELAAFPRFFNTAIRTMAPLLALSSNSPFLPADLYQTDDPYGVVDATPHELRVPVFEQSINAGLDDERAKVRVPGDVESATDVVDRLVEDETYAPFLASDRDDGDATPYPEQYPEMQHKRGTYWRWVRAVSGGSVPRGTAAGDDEEPEASIRLEYRPLPTQPTPTDVVSLQVLTVGLLKGLVAFEHPLYTLAWDAAVESFYDVVENGFDADVAWVTADGEETTDQAVVFEEVFEYARHGLSTAGIDGEDADAYLEPMERRWVTQRAPSDWKKAQVRSRLDDGASLEDAIVGMQREYVRLAGTTERFADWLDAP